MKRLWLAQNPRPFRALDAGSVVEIDAEKMLLAGFAGRGAAGMENGRGGLVRMTVELGFLEKFLRHGGNLAPVAHGFRRASFGRRESLVRLAMGELPREKFERGGVERVVAQWSKESLPPSRAFFRGAKHVSYVSALCS